MRYIDEYRRCDAVQKCALAIRQLATKPWTIMEVCGGQTHAILRFGIDELLPPFITLLHGPGCPVCVTPVEAIDKALQLAARPDVIFCSFGDMLRVPGSRHDLLHVKADGGDVRLVYSPVDAVRIARENPSKEVVFFAVGFETTAPANALAVHQARRSGLKNFSLLVANVLVPPALKTILDSEDCCVNAFLAAGHVCAVTGYEEYEPLARKYKVPIVVTGFEPLDLLQGIYMCVKQLEEGRAEVENQYARVVRREGNVTAQSLVKHVFHVVPRRWRGFGDIQESGLTLAPSYAEYDAEFKFPLSSHDVGRNTDCLSSRVLRGILKPNECPSFGTQCTPEHPVGAPMVSGEGACAAYYRFRRGARSR